MKALVARHPNETKTKAVERAIEEYLRLEAIETLRSLAGTMEIEDVSAELRRIDRRP
jgi:hypothetical protein